MNHSKRCNNSFLVIAMMAFFTTGCSKMPAGIFENNTDVGTVTHKGAVHYNAEKDVYLVSGGGENMWDEADAFQYVWKKASGDLTLSAEVKIITKEGDPHRKAGLIIRQDLDPDAAYVDVVVHGNGLTSLQYREEKGGQTREIQSNVLSPQRIQIEKKGAFVFMSLASGEETPESGGASFKIELSEPFYVGLGVCAHEKDAVTEASFSGVKLILGSNETAGESRLESTLETINIDTKDRKVIYHKTAHFEAPNWSRDGSYFLFNEEGRILKLPVSGGEPTPLNTGFANRANNDHGISPDGTHLAISDQSQGEGVSLVYVLPIEGGTPRQITETGPSYWHGWSPDGKTLAFVGLRNEEYDIYTIPVEGGKETRLTSAQGLDDGPDYSPDGRYIFFNSVRTGTMQIYRLNADGSETTALTDDAFNDWFPHPSPDGKWIVFLSYGPEVEGHPPNKDVMLRLMPAEGGEIQVIAKLFGGQGTINVPSWSPDSKNVAFVSYREVDG